MKSILVYGDSNTWGQTSQSLRYDYDKRWTTKLEKLLGEGVDVYTAGVSGRIAGSYEHVPSNKRGKDSFEVVYRQSFPVDLVVIALGTNDIKKKYNISTHNIFDDLLWYATQVETLSNYDDSVPTTKVLYILPPNFDLDKFDGSEEKRQDLIKMMESSIYESICLNGIEMSEDGVHFSEQGHEQMAKSVYERIKEMNL